MYCTWESSSARRPRLKESKFRQNKREREKIANAFLNHPIVQLPLTPFPHEIIVHLPLTALRTFYIQSL